MNLLRCVDCGSLRSTVRRGDGYEPVPCPDHPESPLMTWGRIELTAYRYVVAYAQKGRDIGLSDDDLRENVIGFADMVAEQRERGIAHWTGVSETNLTIAALLWERWGDVLPEDRERVELPPGGPGLFGRKASVSEVEAYQARVRALRDEKARIA